MHLISNSHYGTVFINNKNIGEITSGPGCNIILIIMYAITMVGAGSFRERCEIAQLGKPALLESGK